MESLNDTSWDITIAGTSVQESLLALALSHSEKKVLHVDRNDYYGGRDATLSLQDAEDWVKKVNNEANSASITSKQHEQTSNSKLSFSRAYSLTLSPQIIYNQSFLLPALVSSRVDTQLEFLAVGSWWVFTDDESHPSPFIRIPNGREDLFADPNLDARSKRGLIKFQRFLAEFEEDSSRWDEEKQAPLVDFLTKQFGLSEHVQQLLLALTFSPFGPKATTVGFSLPRIARHMRSIGLFGPGFGAVIPKWGGLSEIAQVCCRAGAVGGGTYALGNSIKDIQPVSSQSDGDRPTVSAAPSLKLSLSKGDNIDSHYVVSGSEDVPQAALSSEHLNSTDHVSVTRSITIVSSTFATLFPQSAEGAPKPACSVVAFPSAVLEQFAANEDSEHPPVYVMLHSSDTGECPAGQSVLYSSVALPIEEGRKSQQAAIDLLLRGIREDPKPEVLWQMTYEQKSANPNVQEAEYTRLFEDKLLVFPAQPFDLAFDDASIEPVRRIWRSIVDDGGEDSFLVLPDRNNTGEEETTDE